MRRVAERSRKQFVQWGQRGGRVRARRLHPAQRSAIAAQAARARWGGSVRPPTTMSSVRLRAPDWQSPVYLQEVLAEGELADWRVLYRCIAEHPFGATAQALGRVLVAEPIYGVTPLWKGLLRGVQGEL